MPFSTKQLDDLGNNLRNNNIKDDYLSDLQEYRTSYKKPLSEVFNIICEEASNIKKESIITYRIKRIDSIIGKLGRYPKMRFSRMWDIGGCRCILKNDSQVYKLKARLEERLIIRKVNDYIAKPQNEGYKSLHIFVQVENSEKVIEVQIRNQIDHNWATLVEITDLLFDAKLKEYGENKELLRFHYLHSKINHLSIKEKLEFTNILRKYSYFTQLSNVFTRNYIEVRERWLKIETTKDQKYFLIVASKNKIPRIMSFSNFASAEKQYFDVYKSTSNANIVLTHLQNANYSQISTAYSNYVLTFHTFLDECLRLIESLVINCLRKRKIFMFIKQFTIYNSVLSSHIINLYSEIRAAEKIIEPQKNKQRNKNRKNSVKEKDWIKDINKHIKSNNNRINKLNAAIRNNLPHSMIERRLILLTINVINSKYKNSIYKSEKSYRDSENIAVNDPSLK